MIAASAAVLLATTLAGCASGNGSNNNAGAGGNNADCTPKYEFTTVAEGTLTVALYDLPPFSQDDGNNQVSGVDGDIVTAFAEENCLTITANSMQTAAVIPTVQAGKADVALAAWYRTTERDKILNLGDPIYTDQMGIVSKEGVDTVSALENQTVGTVDGYLFVEDLRKLLGGKLKVYPSTLNMYEDLKAGRVSYGVDSYGSAVFRSEGTDYQVKVSQPDERVGASIESAQIGLPTPKGNDGLREALNAFIGEIREDGRLEKMLTDNGLDASAADVGDPRLL